MWGNICEGCGIAQSECNKAKARGMIACCPDCHHTVTPIGNDLKVYAVSDRDCENGWIYVRAASAGKAKYLAAMELDMPFTGVIAHRVPYLDDYAGDLDCNPDVDMALLRHGQPVENHGFIGSLADETAICSDDVDREGEDGYKRYAQLIGASYPDRYSSQKQEG